MSNISHKKRKEMLLFLEELQARFAGTEYEKHARELVRELQRTKYGLVWDEHTEEADGKQPLYREEKDLATDGPGEENYILEGDNLLSLRLLEQNFTEGIDCIYIDPPYNTGNHDFIFNDDMAAREDGFRHSKWLSFMYRRMEIAHRLLKDSGVIFISIDDNEQANLRLMCDAIFGEHNFVGMLPRITKRSGKDHSLGIARNHDYVLIYAKQRSLLRLSGRQVDEAEYPLRDEYYETRGGYKLNQTLDYDSLWYNKSMDFPITVNGREYYPGGSREKQEKRLNGEHSAKDWVWRWSREKLEFGLANGFVVIKPGRDRERIYTKTYAKAGISSTRPYRVESMERKTPLSSLTFTDKCYSNDNAKKEITRLGLADFGFPKPSALIERLVGMTQAGTVLDFFAGSGTTAQAVLELNRRDGGSRRFILCTNNENGICRDITYQRVRTVITGKRADGSVYSQGIPAKVRYFTVFSKKEK